MIALYIGGVTAIILFFGLLFSIFQYASRAHREAKDKGLNPYLPTMWGAFVGYMIGIFIVLVWTAMVRFIGFKPEPYVCAFFGGEEQVCAVYGKPQEDVFIQELIEFIFNPAGEPNFGQGLQR